MEQTSVSTSIGIQLIGKQSEPNKTIPTELQKIMSEFQYEKADGFIHGDRSAKILKNDTVKSGGLTDYYKSITTHINANTDTNKKRDEQAMDNNQNSMDTLFNEIKTDMRERESRSHREISEREQRFERQMEKYAEEASAREERFRSESKERELRITSVLDKLDSKIDSHATHIETMKNQNFWGNIAMFAAMLAIVITLIVALVVVL